MATTYLRHYDKDEITDLLVGRRIVEADMTEVPVESEWSWSRTAQGRLVLDDGTVLLLRGNEGGCSCSAGDYFLDKVATVDNVITGVDFEDKPGGDGYTDDNDYSYEGHYKIFVYTAAHDTIEVASFVGSDGNGYYGTGFEIIVQGVEVTA